MNQELLIENSNIIMTSDEYWSDVWHTQLHYAFQLSKISNVLYLEPPAAWSFSNLFSSNRKIISVFPQLIVMRYHNLLPSGLSKVALWINDKFNENRIKKKFLNHSKKETVIVWHFDPLRSFNILRDNDHAKHIYHVVDPFFHHELDEVLAKTSDLVVVTSPRSIDYYKSLNKNTILIQQGVDLSFFENSNPGTVPAELNGSVLLLGTLSDYIDYYLARKIVETIEGILLIIGPDVIKDNLKKTQFSELLKHPRVRWLGAMNPEEFLPYLRVCNAGIILYDGGYNQKNILRSPLKAISYLGAGKPVISNIDCEIPELEGKAIYSAISDLHYIELLNKVLQRKLIPDQNAIKNYLESIDYRKLISKIISSLHLSNSDESKS